MNYRELKRPMEKINIDFIKNGETTIDDLLKIGGELLKIDDGTRKQMERISKLLTQNPDEAHLFKVNMSAAFSRIYNKAVLPEVLRIEAEEKVAPKTGFSAVSSTPAYQYRPEILYVNMIYQTLEFLEKGIQHLRKSNLSVDKNILEDIKQKLEGKNPEEISFDLVFNLGNKDLKNRLEEKYAKDKKFIEMNKNIHYARADFAKYILESKDTSEEGLDALFSFKAKKNLLEKANGNFELAQRMNKKMFDR